MLNIHAMNKTGMLWNGSEEDGNVECEEEEGCEGCEDEDSDNDWYRQLESDKFILHSGI